MSIYGRVLKVVDSSYVSGVRFVAMCVLSGYCIGASIFTTSASPIPASPFQAKLSEDLSFNEKVNIEHRFSVLETQSTEIKEQLADLKFKGWVQLLASAGLLGEAGIRMAKNRMKSEDDN